MLVVSCALSDARARENAEFIRAEGDRLLRLSEARQKRMVEEFWLREARRREKPEPLGLRVELSMVDPYSL